MFSEVFIINAKAKAKPAAKAVRKRVRRFNAIKHGLRGLYWLLLIAIGCLVLYAFFEIYKAYDQGKRKQEAENALILPLATPQPGIGLLVIQA